MKFLCLHGMGTNSNILEAQIAGICARLEGHDFVFVDGQVECDAADGMYAIAIHILYWRIPRHSWQNPVKSSSRLVRLMENAPS